MNDWRGKPVSKNNGFKVPPAGAVIGSGAYAPDRQSSLESREGQSRRCPSRFYFFWGRQTECQPALRELERKAQKKSSPLHYARETQRSRLRPKALDNLLGRPVELRAKLQETKGRLRQNGGELTEEHQAGPVPGFEEQKTFRTQRYQLGTGFPPGYFKRENAAKRGRKPDPNSKKQRVRKLAERLHRLHLPKAWAKSIETQGLTKKELKEVLAQAASLKKRLDDLRIELRRLIAGGVPDDLSPQLPNGMDGNHLHQHDPSSCPASFHGLLGVDQ